MARTWPSFTTRDLGDSPEDDIEMLRRWELYNTEMQAIIAAGGVHQDADGWWIDDATGDLIGPDPELERPRTDEELAQAMPFAEACPELAASILRERPDLAEAMERTREAGARAAAGGEPAAAGVDPAGRGRAGQAQGDRAGVADAGERDPAQGGRLRPIL